MKHGGSVSSLVSVAFPSHPIAVLIQATGPHQDSLPGGRMGIGKEEKGTSRKIATFAISRERLAGPALRSLTNRKRRNSCKRERVMAVRCGYGAPQRPVVPYTKAGQLY